MTHEIIQIAAINKSYCFTIREKPSVQRTAQNRSKNLISCKLKMYVCVYDVQRVLFTSHKKSSPFGSYVFIHVTQQSWHYKLNSKSINLLFGSTASQRSTVNMMKKLSNKQTGCYNLHVKKRKIFDLVLSEKNLYSSKYVCTTPLQSSGWGVKKILN